MVMLFWLVLVVKKLLLVEWKMVLQLLTLIVLLWLLYTTVSGGSYINGHLGHFQQNTVILLTVGGDNSVTTFSLDSDADCSELTGCMDMNAEN